MVSPPGPVCISAGLPMIASTSRCVDWPATRPRPSTLAQEAMKSKRKNQPPARLRLASPLDRGAAKNSAALLALAGFGSEVLLEFLGFTFVLVGVRGRGALARDVRPLDGELGVHLEPFFRLAVGVGNDGIGRALGLADAAIDAFVRMDHQHVVALVEAVDGADLHAVHVLALDAVFGDDVSHLFLSHEARFRGPDYRT